ncbi:MAG TPA: TlpA disulfide reductase family protein [Verrucomicrobiae bacterium]|nr:TlpA disulfide reductase family protein [Verrucomicrobiae bacterium]
MHNGVWTATAAKPVFRRFAFSLLLVTIFPASLARAQSPPANDNFVNAIPILSTNITVNGDNDYATKEPGEPDHAGNPGGKSVWWTWQAPAVGYVTISTHGSTSSVWGGPLDTLLAVYVGNSVSNVNEIASNDEDPATSLTSLLGFKATAGTLYRIAVDGYSPDTPADADSGAILLSLTLSGLAPNDDFADAIQLTGTNLIAIGNNDHSTKEPGEPDHAGNPGGKSVWWTWQAPVTGFVTISTQGSVSSQSGSDLDALLAVYVGKSVSNLSEVASVEGSPASTTFRVDAGKVYRIAVDGFTYDTPTDADSGAIKLSLSIQSGLPLAPAWGPLPDIYGNMVDSTSVAGKVVLLNFWATWCGPCVAEIPDLISLYQKYSPDGLVIVGISIDSSPDGRNPPTSLVSSFVFNNGMTYPVLMDQPSWWSVETSFGGIQFIPTTFVIDSQNHICQKFVGSQTFATFEQAVLPLLYQNLALNLTLNSGQAHISWPVTQATFILETTQDLTGDSWVPVSVSAQSDGINEFVDLPTSAGGQFFRLRSQ